MTHDSYKELTQYERDVLDCHFADFTRAMRNSSVPLADGYHVGRVVDAIALGVLAAARTGLVVIPDEESEAAGKARDVLRMIRKHAIQAQVQPQFAKDEAHDIELLCDGALREMDGGE